MEKWDVFYSRLCAFACALFLGFFCGPIALFFICAVVSKIVGYFFGGQAVKAMFDAMDAFGTDNTILAFMMICFITIYFLIRRHDKIVDEEFQEYLEHLEDKNR